MDGKYQAVLEDEETVQIFDSLQDLSQFTNPRFGFYYRDKVGKVQINNIPMYRTLHGFYNIPGKLLVDDVISFPTEVPKAKKRKHSHHRNKKNRSSKDTGSSGFTFATTTTPQVLQVMLQADSPLMLTVNTPSILHWTHHKLVENQVV